ncbi:DNA repair protein rad10 [Trichodelitschia bisporula]|uniref:DNA repair protein rad10 n=1 Tax=Trichodelitschia bisporula TaxID=703511 RepID=A0A6G1HYL7_9PEZI|nr:DNA repair protein rad10 [Trichodelitschia bisporula]
MYREVVYTNPPPTNTTTAPTRAVQQPRPQALPVPTGPNTILVSPRQKENPILKEIRSTPWEWADIPADYVLGTTTCALFLSLKYHRLKPEYIYARIRGLAGKYALRVLLVVVDIPNHEESLRELSKASLINNVTLILCWSAAEAARYLELYKMYQNTTPTAIRAPQSRTYAEQMTEFVTTPRSVNKTDALALVTNFGSVRTAVNAKPEEIRILPGWGQTKVKHWCSAVRDPFRAKTARRRTALTQAAAAGPSQSGGVGGRVGEPIAARAEFQPPRSVADGIPDANRRPVVRPAAAFDPREPDEDEEAVMREMEMEAAAQTAAKPPGPSAANPKKRPAEPEVGEGVLAALERLRQNG